MYDFKIEIEIDEDKVIEDDKYDPQDLYKYIRDMYSRFHLYEVKTDKPNHIIFTDTGRNTDLGAIGSVTVDLYDSDWCRKYAKRFIWTEPDEYNEPMEMDVFKLIDSRRRRVGRK